MAFPAFEDKEIQYAYHSIHDFFDSFGLSALRHTESMLNAAITNKVWKKTAPSRLLLLAEKLEELIFSALTILYSGAIRKEAILEEPAEPDIYIQQNFVSRYACSSIWRSFPRSLTAKQFNNPYLAIKKFAAYMPEQKWKQTIKDCLEYALSTNPVYEAEPPCNILTIRLRLLQLIEACQLIDIRTESKKAAPVNETTNEPK